MNNKACNLDHYLFFFPPYCIVYKALSSRIYSFNNASEKEVPRPPEKSWGELITIGCESSGRKP